jgi:gliding motility-associated-like protein
MRYIVILYTILVPFISLAQVTFRSVTSLDAPDTPYEMAKGDFNKDGRIDLITANFTGLSNQQVSVLLNTGSGTFAGSNFKNVGASANVLDIATGDFNKDGNLDAVACSQTNDNFSLLLGDGAGNFSAPVNFTTGDVPNGIASGDMNKDGNLDVLVTNRGVPEELHIFYGNGAGNFSAPVKLAIANVWDVAIADFNNDTHLDFAILTSGVYTVQIWLSNGLATPSFTLSQTVVDFGISGDIDAHDLDGDGDMDLIGSSAYTLNTGAGVFGTRVFIPQTDEEYAVGDLNGDNKPDLVATDNNNNSSNIRVYRGDGTGTFTLLGKYETVAYHRGLEIVDVNNDGYLDVVGAGTFSGQGKIDILLGDGSGYLTNSVSKYVTLTDPQDLAKGDFNEDGKIDIATCHSVANSVSVYVGQGGDRFSKTSTDYTTGAFPSQLLAFDYNKDGHMDLATLNQNSASVTVLTGDGTGTFNLLSNFSVTLSSFGRMAIADFNNDTYPDITVSGWTARVINFLAGTGSGFNASVTSAVSADVYEIKAADFTGDGKQDLVADLGNIKRMVLLIGNGTGSFTEGSTQYQHNGSLFLVADMNADSKPDVIAFANSSLGHDFFTNDGTGVFSGSSISVSLGGIPFGFEDMNNDGFKDLIVGAQNSSSSSPGQIVIFRGSAAGITSGLLIDKDYSGGNRLVLHDINNDGKMDIMATSFSVFSEDYLSVLTNTTVAVGCPAITTQPVSQNSCEGKSVSFSVVATGNSPLSYQWRMGATPIAGATSSTFTIAAAGLSDAGTYSCVVSNGCGSVTSNTASLTVAASPAMPTATGVSRCGPGSVVLTASGGSNGDYRWYTVSSGGSPLVGEQQSSLTLASITSSTTYYVSLVSGSCESNRASIPIIINSIPATPAISATPVAQNGVIIACSSSAVVLEAPSGFTSYQWSSGESTQQLSVTSSGSYSVEVTNALGCKSLPSSAIQVNIVSAPCNNQPPSIISAQFSTAVQGSVLIDLNSIISDPDNNLVLSSIEISMPPASGAVAVIDQTNSILTVDYTGISFTGSDELIIKVCDAFNLCAEQSILIEVVGEVAVYNALSPNGDGKNDVFILQYIDLIEGTKRNRLTIYNRWGDNVFDITDYDNSSRVFKGQNSSGNDLPSGIYYYKIEFFSGRPDLTGYLMLKR